MATYRMIGGPLNGCMYGIDPVALNDYRSEVLKLGTVFEVRVGIHESLSTSAALELLISQHSEVSMELARAKEKFPLWPTDAVHCAAIVAEEMGEVQKAILESIYEPHKSTVQHVVKEARQLAAMALRFLENVGQMEFKGTGNEKTSGIGSSAGGGAHFAV